MNDIIWSPGMTLEIVEKLVIQKAYQFFRFNKTTTANALGISIRTLDSKLEQYDQENGLAKEREAYEQRQRNEFLARSRGQVPDNIGIHIAASTKSSAFPSASAGVRVESIINATTEQAMSLPERKEVQAVLPKQTSQGHKGKGR